MPNQHAPDKACVSVWVSRTLRRRLEKEAKKRGKTLTELCEDIYSDATRKTELTPEDYRKIAEDVEKAKLGIDRRLRSSRNKSQAPQGG